MSQALSIRQSTGTKRKRAPTPHEPTSDSVIDDSVFSASSQDFHFPNNSDPLPYKYSRQFGEFEDDQTRDEQPPTGPWLHQTSSSQITHNSYFLDGHPPNLPVPDQTSTSICNDPGFPWSEPFNFQCADFQPCNNPACEDVQPCQLSSDPCFDPQQCLGNICFDENCNGADFFCDEECHTATGCATPCYGDECGMPACEEACPSTLPWVDGCSTSNHRPLGEEVVCQSRHCSIPGITCVDPQCLSLEYAPASHVHHKMQEFRKHEVCYEPDSLDACGHTISQHDCSFHKQPLSYPHVGNRAKHSSDCHAHSAQLLQPLLDWDLAPHPARKRSRSLTDADSATPSLSHSSTATPTTTTSKTLPNTQFFSLGAHGRHLCLWMEGQGIAAKTCGREFGSAADLHAHVESSHVKDLPRDHSVAQRYGFHCCWLGCPRPPSSSLPAAFATRPKLRRHVHIHTGHTPFKCAVCGMAMKTKDAMEKHERTHSKEKPYHCAVPSCPRCFATSTELKTHEVLHRGEKPHVCDKCNERFADSSNLSKHKKTHFVGIYKCPDCSAQMKRWDQMKRHMTSQKHGTWILGDEQATREYKARMEVEGRDRPMIERRVDRVRQRNTAALLYY